MWPLCRFVFYGKEVLGKKAVECTALLGRPHTQSVFYVLFKTINHPVFTHNFLQGFELLCQKNLYFIISE